MDLTMNIRPLAAAIDDAIETAERLGPLASVLLPDLPAVLATWDNLFGVTSMEEVTRTLESDDPEVRQAAARRSRDIIHTQVKAVLAGEATVAVTNVEQ